MNPKFAGMMFIVVTCLGLSDATWLYAQRETPAASAAADADTLEVRVFKLKYAHAPDLANVINQVHGVKIASDWRSNSLVCNADKKSMMMVEKLIQELDVPSPEQPTKPTPYLAPRTRRTPAGASTPAATSDLAVPTVGPSVSGTVQGVPPDVGRGGGTQIPATGDVYRYGGYGGATAGELPPELFLSALRGGRPASSAYTAAERKAQDVANEYRMVAEQSRNSADADNLQASLRELKTLVKASIETAFQERQKTQTAELEKLRERLKHIEQMISDREKNREPIINRRVEELINPNLDWESGAAAGRYQVAPSLTTTEPAAAGARRRVRSVREVLTDEGPKTVIEESVIEPTDLFDSTGVPAAKATAAAPYAAPPKSTKDDAPVAPRPQERK